MLTRPELQKKILKIALRHPEARRELVEILAQDGFSLTKFAKEKTSEKIIQKMKLEKGGLHKSMGIPAGEPIPVEKAEALYKKLQKESEGDKKLSPEDLKTFKQLQVFLKVLRPASQKKKK